MYVWAEILLFLLAGLNLLFDKKFWAGVSWRGKTFAYIGTSDETLVSYAPANFEIREELLLFSCPQKKYILSQQSKHSLEYIRHTYMKFTFFYTNSIWWGCIFFSFAHKMECHEFVFTAMVLLYAWSQHRKIEERSYENAHVASHRIDIIIRNVFAIIYLYAVTMNIKFEFWIPLENDFAKLSNLMLFVFYYASKS